MLKINYPTIPAELTALHSDYKKSLDVTAMQTKLTKFFNLKELKVIPNPPKVETLLVMNFESLLKESLRLKKYIKKQVYVDKLKRILNYDLSGPGCFTKQQPNIAEFFGKHQDKINLATCYYCNIDYITAFRDFGDFKNGLDFVKRARKDELISIKGIGPAKAEIIIQDPNRKKLKKMDDLPAGINPTDRDNLNKLIVNEYSSHFTLDHVLSKSDHPIAALSLYNFVPSCYSCNSKFKNAKKLIEKVEKSFLSPTSVNHSFSKEFKFKLFFEDNRDPKKLDIKAISEFYIDFDISINRSDYELFLNIFKVHSRYVFHKREISDLIRKKIKYDDSHIDKIAKLIKASPEQVKEDIFGKELFDTNPENYPLSKLKRDIAKEIGIKGIK
jgi:hypothetical protein